MSVSQPQTLRAVLWDMDGTLLDSGEYHWLAWRDSLADEGYALAHEQFLAAFGQRNDAVLRSYFGPDFPDSAIERIGADKEQRYRDLVRARGIELLPGVRGWLDRLRAAGWRQAIASAAPRPNIDVIVSALGLDGVFDALVSAEDVQRGKPDPQVFLVAAERLAVPPARCIVVEDAPAGVEAGRRAGMRTIGVLTSRAELVADLVVPTLDRLPEDAFEALLERR